MDLPWLSIFLLVHLSVCLDILDVNFSSEILYSFIATCPNLKRVLAEIHVIYLLANTT